MSDHAVYRGKRRAEPKRRGRRREDRPAGGRRADRPEEHEGITPEFLEQMREPDAEPRAVRPRTGPGVRELLAGIDADLRADVAYQHALSRLAHG